jgi:uncharacterized protein
VGRFLVLVLIVVAVVWLARRAIRTPEAQDVAQKPSVHGDLVSCERCGVHLPRGEARESGGALYCSEEHARLGRGRGA